MSSKPEPPKQDRPLGNCKVCLKKISRGEDHFRVHHAGSDYLVCCASCAAKFEADPRAYLVD